jgi:hypothetical protein
MSKESRILLFKDKHDYQKKITNDEIINVTGSVGSGKSTYGIKYHDNLDYIVINFDSISSDSELKTLNKDVLELRKVLLKKFGNLKLDEMIYYSTIVEFINSNNKKGIIEGGHLTHVKNIDDFKGTIVVKRTARFKCAYRTVLRDIKNPYYRKSKTLLEKLKRDWHCIKRFNVIKRHTYIENFIERLEEYEEKK